MSYTVVVHVTQGFSPDTVGMPLNPHQPYPHRPRLQDKESYRGIRGHFITVNTWNREPYFAKANVAPALITKLQEVAKAQAFDVIAYCFMPDHCHLVLTGKNETSDLLQCISAYKQHTGYDFTHSSGRRLWATSFYDHVLRKEENIKTVGRYVLLNPVRAGLVKNVLEYPYGGSFVYNLKELVSDDPFLTPSSIM